MKKLFFLSAVCAVFFLFSGCERIKELSTVNVPVAKVEFNFEAMEIGAMRADMSSFEWTRRLSLTDVSASLEQYDVTYFKGATCESASVRVYSPDGTAGNVEDFKIVTTNGLSFTKSAYTLGDTYSGNDLVTFAGNLIFYMLTKPPFDLTVSGKTDLAPGEKIAVDVQILDIVVTVQLLK